MLRKLAPALVASLVVVAACAREADSERVVTGAEAAAALRAAPDLADARGSATFEMTIALGAPEGSVEVVASGAFRGDALRMSMDLGSALATLTEPGESIPTGFGEPVELVIDGETAYLRVPMLAGLTGTTGWLSTDLAELASVGESFGLGAGTSHPSQLLEVLRGVADEIEVIGSDAVRGVTTTHLRATVDIERAIQGASPADRPALEAQLAVLAASGGSIPLDVWIDSDGLARRVVVDLGAVAAATGGVGGTATMTLEVFDYGEPVQIVVPDPADVTPMHGALRAFGGLG